MYDFSFLFFFGGGGGGWASIRINIRNYGIMFSGFSRLSFDLCRSLVVSFLYVCPIVTIELKCFLIDKLAVFATISATEKIVSKHM